jgi:hypothetical protein
VLNARRSLLRVKLEKPLAEFKAIAERVKNLEIEGASGSVQE